MACGAGFSVALCSSYKVYSWGNNLAGQLGQGFLGGGRFPHFNEEAVLSAPEAAGAASSPNPNRLDGAHGSRNALGSQCGGAAR